MRRRPRLPANAALGLAGSVLVHAVAGAFLFASVAETRPPPPPTYKVRLIAAPRPEAAETRRAPEAFERPPEEQGAPVPPSEVKRLPERAATPPPPPPTVDPRRREAPPRTTPKATPLPGERPATGRDAATVSTEGMEFPYPEYLQNIVSQVLRRWQRPLESTPLDAEVSFFVHRDGSVTALQFVKRSGNFAFDLEAQGAVEEAGRFKAFGPLPDGWTAGVLFVRFYFTGQRQ